MPSLNFTKFADKVIDGRKPHTIRATRKIPIKAGDDLSFFTGMRTKACRRIRDNQPCVAAAEIEIVASMSRVRVGSGSLRYQMGALSTREIRALAIADGFNTVAEFFTYFGRNGLKFTGQLVEWMP